MDIVFLRHGETFENRKGIVQGHNDTPLTAKGKRQASRVGETIREKFDVDAVYTSDLQRAVRTADLLEIDAPREQDSRLRELDFGQVSGGSLAEFIERHPEYSADQPYALWTRFPGGESTGDVYHRVTDALSEVVGQHADDETIVVVGHHTSLATALAYARDEGVDHTADIDVPIGSGFHATVDGNEWTVERWPLFDDL